MTVPPAPATRGLVQRRIGARELDNTVRTSPFGVFAYGQCKITLCRRQRRSTELLGQLQPMRHGVNGDDRNALADQQLGGQQRVTGLARSTRP
jgi:hypothetical protein